ncbi:MAG: ATPase [bacterium]|nr:ATPase [bacterium]
MRIAIPTVDGRLCMHFGHCERFAVIDIDTESKTVRAMESVVPPPHAPGEFPRWLASQGVNAIIAGGMGFRAQQLFAASGIEVVVGAPSEEPRMLAEAHMNGTLEAGENVCDH